MAIKAKAYLAALMLPLLCLGVIGHTALAADGQPDDGEAKSTGALEELIVTGRKGADPTVIEPKTQQLFSIAGAADDPLQAIFALPGVTFSVEGEPVIRGSAPQDNAYYIDLIPAEYLFHVFGNSIFNKNLIRKFELYPAAFPSQFSNATGGVIDVHLRAPRNQGFTTTINWSFLIAGAMVESRVTENQAFYLSYRRSLLDQFFDLLTGGEGEDDAAEAGFRIAKFPVAHDYQFKYNWYVNDQNTLSFLAAGAGDNLAGEVLANSELVMRDPDFAGPIGYDDGFDSQGITWDWQSENADKQLKTTFSRIVNDTEFYYGAGQRVDIYAERFLTRLDYNQTIVDRHQLTVGVSHERRSYNNNIHLKFVACTDFDPECSTLEAEFISVQNKVGVNINSFFVQDIFDISERQQLTFGLHYFADDHLNESRLEPRARWQYNLTDSWQVAAAMGQYSQLPELEQIIPGVGNPNLSTIKANHVVLGIEQALARGWSWKADVYYKQLQDVVTSADDPAGDEVDPRYSNDAKGKAYGAEIVINKDPTGRWFGWFAVSLSKTERTNTRTGATAPFTYDRPVMLDLVLNYDLSQRWRAGIKWSYQSGGLYTPVVELLPNSNNVAILEPVYGEFNSQRYPDYHRLDFRLQFLSPRKWGHWSFYLDLINAYNKKSIQTYDYTLNPDEALASPPPGYGENVPAVAETTFGLFPSIGFELEF